MTKKITQIIKINKINRVIVFALLLFSPVLLAKDYNFTAAESIINGYVDTHKIAGGVILVMKDGKELLHIAVGKQDVEADKDMKIDSLFRIASQTKALTSVGVMILKERGLINFTDPISKYIPSFKKTSVLVVHKDKSYTEVPAVREITVHDLLTHSAGISYGWGIIEEKWKEIGLHGWYFADKKQTMKQALAPLTTLPQQAQPGSEFVYGHSTDLLGVIIESISGKNLKEFFETEITGPLGMIDTHFYIPKSKLSRLAAVYNATDSHIKRASDTNTAEDYMLSQGHYAAGPMQAFSGGAGLVSTASDYSKLLLMLLNQGTLNGTKILSPSSVVEMTSNQIPYIDMDWNDGFGYGFALTIGKAGDLKGKTLQYEWGGAYNSKYYVRPEDGVIVIYLTQLIPTSGLKDWEEINAVIKIALGIAP
ncbi:serine hydrolase domain-containing protein [Paraglaciecola psychrophila]|jgi:CubicO group peptidase (beta-lactamase class C family)|nr:serine hydrolase domain-containing protein [Paraglaciecola psychrophila]GAC36185.1 beta-lactamase [Paraglaciecola psychrophila 170]